MFLTKTGLGLMKGALCCTEQQQAVVASKADIKIRSMRVELAPAACPTVSTGYFRPENQLHPGTHGGIDLAFL